MTTFQHIVLWLGWIATAGAALASVLGVVALIKHWDVEYRKRYNDFLTQKERVERRLKEAAHD